MSDGTPRVATWVTAGLVIVVIAFSSWASMMAGRSAKIESVLRARRDSVEEAAQEALRESVFTVVRGAESLKGFDDSELALAVSYAEQKGIPFPKPLTAEVDRRQHAADAKQAQDRVSAIYQQAIEARTQDGKRSHRVTQARVRQLVKQHGDWDDNMLATIACGFIQLHMTADQVRASWGRPEDVNRTVGNWGVHEQWVYNSPYGPYVYFEDGMVTSWQN